MIYTGRAIVRKKEDNIMTRKILELSLSGFLIVITVSIIFLGITIKPIVEQYGSILEKQREAQEEIIYTANKIEDVVFEAAFSATVLTLSEKDVIPGTTAEKMIAESIENISKHSKRLAKLAEYLNDYRLKQIRR